VLHVSNSSNLSKNIDSLFIELEIASTATISTLESLEYLMDNHINAIMIDTDFGLSEIVNFLEIINEDVENTNTPIIIISDLEDNEELAISISAFNVISIFNYQNYYLQLRNLFQILKLQLDYTSTLKNELIQSEKRNIIDPLTGALNRYGAQDKFHYLTARFKAYNENFSLIMLDIDHFKNVNDTHGHDVGDEVLVSISNILQNSIRSNDALIRFGGEEFFLFLSNVNLEISRNIAEKLRIMIKQTPHSLKALPITASFGVVEYSISEELDALIKRADTLLYKAKENGRDQVAIS